MEIAFDERQLRDLQKAIQRNPQAVTQAVGRFLVHGMAVLNRGIIRNPWRVGMQGGGAPVLTGNLRDTHMKEVSSMSARVYPTAEYAESVHTGRPWLDHVFNTSKNDILRLEGELLDSLVNDLAR